MNPLKIAKILEALAMLRYFPSGNVAVLDALVRLVGSMCATEDQVRWLVDRMTSGIYAEWPGPQEMRACFCSRYPPKDGINAYSQVYPDGLPPSREALKAIAAAPVLQLPEGRNLTADASMDAAVELLVKANRIARNM